MEGAFRLGSAITVNALADRWCSRNVPTMVSHSIRQARRDDLAFPVRVKVRVPDHGLGKTLDRMTVWLRENASAKGYACHSSPGVACSTAAFYFCDIDVAQKFVRSFPEAKLADGTISAKSRK
jgi:hypothetical protein